MNLLKSNTIHDVERWCEMRELGIVGCRVPIAKAILVMIAFTNVAATTLTLIASGR